MDNSNYKSDNESSNDTINNDISLHQSSEYIKDFTDYKNNKSESYFSTSRDITLNYKNPINNIDQISSLSEFEFPSISNTDKYIPVNEQKFEFSADENVKIIVESDERQDQNVKDIENANSINEKEQNIFLDKNNSLVDKFGNAYFINKQPQINVLTEDNDNFYNLYKHNFPNSRQSRKRRAQDQNLDILIETMQFNFNKDLIKILDPYLVLLKDAIINFCINKEVHLDQDIFKNSLIKLIDNAKLLLDQLPKIEKQKSSHKISKKLEIPNKTYKRRISSYDLTKAHSADNNLKYTQSSKNDDLTIKTRISRRANSPKEKPKVVIGGPDAPIYCEDMLKSDTDFVLGSDANRLIGFAAARGRLYIKHPYLFKYPTDIADKQWLSKNKIMPVMCGRAFLMLASDIHRLVTCHEEYKDKINYKPTDLKPFKVPSFMLAKIRTCLVSFIKITPSE